MSIDDRKKGINRPVGIKGWEIWALGDFYDELMDNLVQLLLRFCPNADVVSIRKLGQIFVIT